jgi:hypothetical protein
MNNDDSIKNLLIQVSAITKKYENIAEITGENFNVFKVLGLTTREVQTHSAFLIELLNPKGSHGCKDIFLKIFIDQMRQKFYDDQKSIDDQKFIKRFQNFKTENAKASVEHHIGIINESWEEGGRIDIHIQDKENNVVIIENKIFARDQKNQLVRYHNAYPRAPIFYLTLKGINPFDDSKGSLKKGEEFECISYKVDIITWLEQCLKEAVNHAILRETIRQYINLIKFLTNQTINDKMREEIVKTIINSPESLKAFYEIQKSNVMADVRKSLITKFHEQLTKLSGELNLELVWDSKLELGVDSDCGLRLKMLSTKYYILFGFCEPKYFGMVFGIYANDKLYDPKVREWISKKLGLGQFNADLGNWLNWLWIDYLTPEFKNWDEHIEPWLAILDGKLINNFSERIKELIDIIKEIERTS